MAYSLLNLTTILSLIISLALHSQFAFSNDDEHEHEHELSNDIEDDEEYAVDSPFTSLRSRSRFLASVVKKGAYCDPIKQNVCNGVSANTGTSLLYCCKTHCRDVLSDKNNCGQCGKKCNQGEHCCSGNCINTSFNDNHCGKCYKKCSNGVKCEFGSCGYA